MKQLSVLTHLISSSGAYACVSHVPIHNQARRRGGQRIIAIHSSIPIMRLPIYAYEL